MHPRFHSYFGNDDMNPGDPPVQGRMHAFSSRYSFLNTDWCIVIWAYGWSDARNYARKHGLTIDGKIEGVFED